MKLEGWLFSALLAGGVVLGFRASGGCLDRSEAPDEKLAGHFEDLCGIARDNVKTPEAGVRKLGRYMGSHTDDMLAALGGTIQTIERIADDEDHDARARLARDRFAKPLRACERDWMRFIEAVDADPAANALIEHTSKRLERTLNIIFKGATLDLRTLPHQLEHLLESETRESDR